MTFLLYDTSTGEILQQIETFSREDAELDADGVTTAILPVDDTIDDALMRVDLNTLTVVPKTPVPFVLTNTTFTGLPAGTIALVILGPNADERVRVDDGVLDLVFAEPGEYSVTLGHPIHLPVEETVVAT